MLINIILKKDFQEQMYQGRSYVKDATGMFFRLQDLSGTFKVHSGNLQQGSGECVLLSCLAEH